MYRILVLSVIAVAIFLRLLLCWENNPDNAFDDHYGPISLILKTGEIPAKNACWQCYQPPVFYYSSAMVAKSLINLGVAENYQLKKALQLLNCLYIILTLLVIYLSLQRLHFAETSCLVAFSLICFLPRHIFMSAMHSNDSLAYLGVALCAYLLLVAIDRKLPWAATCLLGAVVTLTIFVKYTALIVLPMVSVPLMCLLFVKSPIPRSKAVIALVLVILVPGILFGNYMASSYLTYGQVLPWNDTMIDTRTVHPRDTEDVEFFSFTPWQYVKEPLVIPGQMHSFWTLIYSGMLIDSEPKFTHVTDRSSWWEQYFNWLRGTGAFPSDAIPVSPLTRTITAGLLVCGMVPLILALFGLIKCVKRCSSTLTCETVKLQVFAVMLAFNAIGVIYLVMKAPVYSSMKASYFLNSLPAFAVFIALSIEGIEETSIMKRFIVPVCCTAILLSTLYVFRIFGSLHFI